MDLKRRLSQYDSLARKPRHEPADAPVADGSAATGDSGDGPPWALALGLRRRACEGGEVWIAEGKEPRPQRVDPEPLRSLTLVLTGAIPENLAPDEILLVDTETTGLVGGTGSLAFLTGCAWWEGEAWRWRQYFLPAPGREAPILNDLAALAARFRVVVTFNGAVFDLPLLRTRALLSRVKDPLGDLASWDLLPVSRRLWGRRLPDCRQQTVEAHAAGCPRATEEIDGGLIPHVYFQFLRTGAPGLLPAVLTRNRHDLEGMAGVLSAAAQRTTLIARAAEGIALGSGVSAAAANLHWADAWAAGRLCERAGRHAQAAAWLRSAIEGRGDPVRDRTDRGWETGSRPAGRLARRSLLSARTPASREELLFRDAIRLFKRARDWPTVENALRTALAACGARPWIHREAAILYEHRLHRPDLAWPHAEWLGETGRLLRLRARLGPEQAADPSRKGRPLA